MMYLINHMHTYVHHITAGYQGISCRYLAMYTFIPIYINVWIILFWDCNRSFGISTSVLTIEVPLYYMSIMVTFYIADSTSMYMWLRSEQYGYQRPPEYPSHNPHATHPSGLCRIHGPRSCWDVLGGYVFLWQEMWLVEFGSHLVHDVVWTSPL